MIRVDCAPHEGAGAADPHVPCAAGAAGAAGWSQLGLGAGGAAGAAAAAGCGGGATTVDETGATRVAEGGGAHVWTAGPGTAASAVVAAAAAAPRDGAAGRTAFFGVFAFTRRRRTNRYMTPATSATTARIISAYSIGIRWSASLLADW